MLYLATGGSVAGTLRAVLDYLDTEIARYNRQAKHGDTPMERLLNAARRNALTDARRQLADSNVALA